MTNFKIVYNYPWLLLLVIPALLLALVPHFLTEKRYRRTRNRVVSLVAFIVASILSVNLLAGVSFAYENPNENNELIILVDVSESGDTERREKDELVESIVSIADGDYNVGIVKFGYGQVYAAELSANTDKVLADYRNSSDPDTTASDIASALEYTMGLFSYPQSAKIVLLSDGIETDRDALSVIKAIAFRGVRVDTVHFPSDTVPEVQIVGVDIPEQYLMIDEPFTVDVHIKTNIPIQDELLVDLKFSDKGNVVGETQLSITSKEMVVPVEITLDQRGFHDLAFEISNPGDTSQKNNVYHTYVSIQQFNKILLIEKYAGESAKLREVLGNNYDITTLSIEESFSDIPRSIDVLAEYEQVILVNIAYSDMPTGFEELLNRYVYNLGGGLFTVGGINDGTVTNPIPHAYNREDLEKSTYYQKMLPVSAIDFTPPTAVMIVIDSSGSMTEEVDGISKYLFALEGATACLDSLGDRDYCGIVSFQSSASEKMQLIPVAQKERILDVIADMKVNQDAGDTIFSDAIIHAGEALSVLDNVDKKHIIMITDGRPSDKLEVYGEYIKDNANKDITMSIITVGNSAEGDKGEMSQAAAMGNGKHHHVTDTKEIVEIMQTDLLLKAIPEIDYGNEFNLSIKDRTNVVAGIDSEESIPVLTGYYGTVKKADAVVPLMGKYVPIYAQWKYGNGNVGSFMCDLNGTWSEKFVNDPVGQSIIRNIVDNIFPTYDVRSDGITFVVKTDNYTTQLNVHGVPEDHRIEVEVLPISNTLVDLMETGIRVTEAEGNRRFIFTLKDAGLYQILVKRFDEENALLSEITLYKNFSYSEEYNYFTEREPIGDELLSKLSRESDGIMVEDAAEIFNTFDKTVKREYDPRIPMLIIIILAVLIDVAVRKFKFKWIHEIIKERKYKKAEEAKRKG